MSRSRNAQKHVVKPRCAVAYALRLRGGGSKNHGDKRKQVSKSACRGKVQY